MIRLNRPVPNHNKGQEYTSRINWKRVSLHHLVYQFGSLILHSRLLQRTPENKLSLYRIRTYRLLVQQPVQSSNQTNLGPFKGNPPVTGRFPHKGHVMLKAVPRKGGVVVAKYFAQLYFEVVIVLIWGYLMVAGQAKCCRVGIFQSERYSSPAPKLAEFNLLIITKAVGICGCRDTFTQNFRFSRDISSATMRIVVWWETMCSNY